MYIREVKFEPRSSTYLSMELGNPKVSNLRYKALQHQVDTEPSLGSWQREEI